MKQFILKGQISGVSLGTKRSDVLEILGVPPMWGGKPPTFGEEIVDYRDASLWLYFDSAVGVSFNKTDEASELILNMETLNSDKLKRTVLVDSAISTTGELVEWLDSQGIAYKEAGAVEEPYWMIVAGKCVVFSIPFDAGQTVAHRKRRIYSLNRVETEEQANLKALAKR